MKTLCIGSCSYDTIVLTNSFPTEGSITEFNEKIEEIGGSAALVATLLGLWKQEVYFAGLVGNDETGSKIKKDLDSSHVYTHYLETDYEQKTNTSFIIVNKEKGLTTNYELKRQYIPLKKCHLDFIPDMILTDCSDPIVSRDLINSNQSAISILKATKFNNDTLEICKIGKYIIASKNFAENLSKMKIDFNNKQSIVNLYQEIINKYPKANIIIDLEENGVVYNIEKNIKLMPGINNKRLDNTASDDVFIGAFAYGISNKMSLEDTIRYSIIASSLSRSKIGAKDSIPSLEDVKIVYEKN